jgi:hypothetical protein
MVCFSPGWLLEHHGLEQVVAVARANQLLPHVFGLERKKEVFFFFFSFYKTPPTVAAIANL